MGERVGWLAEQMAMQRDRWTLWTPVALGAGCACYFTLLREPQAWAAYAGLGIAGLLLAAAARVGFRMGVTALALLACMMAGFCLAKVRTERVWAPVAPASSGPQRIDGWVVDVASPGEGGQRLLIAPAGIGDWSPAATPIRVRVTLRPGAPIPAPGSPISILAMVNPPPPPPASPGAYDFARDAFFQSVGGVGFALGPPATWRTGTAPPWRLAWRMRINTIRWELARRIVDQLGPSTGGLAAAMTTGHEAFVPRDQEENLRIAGLAHIVSISGLHMAIVGGFAFAGARLLIAAWPWLALRAPGKKLAALAGLAAVGGYLVISGAPPPAERAAITAAAAFCAILVDRQAISLHALALAAMAILILQPEAVTGPGFQMSFAATVALVALAEAWRPPPREIDVPWQIRMVQAAGVWILASLAASFVAGLATGPFAMQHFNRVATWGLLANLAVAPISSFLMMPGLALGAALTPLGLGEGPLAVAGFAIEQMNRIAAAVAAAPNAQLVVASGPAWVLPTAFLGILWLCLWKGPLRWAGLPFALAVALVPKPPAPDAWISNDGAAVAIREGRTAVLMRPDVKLFGAEFWARRHGLTPGGERAGPFDCDAWSCRPKAGAAVPVAAAWNVRRPLKEGRLAGLCASAEVVVIRTDQRPEDCGPALVFSGADFRRGGAAELYRQAPGRWRVVWAQDLRGHRPWTWGHDPRRD